MACRSFEWGSTGGSDSELHSLCGVCEVTLFSVGEKAVWLKCPSIVVRAKLRECELTGGR